MSQAEISRYEMVVLFRPEFETKMDEPLKTVADLVQANSGEIISEDDWGRKELAYKIAGETHAIYRVYQLNLPKQAPAKIDGVLNITDSVIRHLITKVDEKVERALAEEKKARANREATRTEQANDEA